MIQPSEDETVVGRIARVNRSGEYHRSLCLVILKSPRDGNDFLVRFADGEIRGYYRTCLVPLDMVEMVAALETEPAILDALRRRWIEEYEPFHNGFHVRPGLEEAGD